MIEEELIRLRQAKEELKAQMDLQNKMIEQQKKHFELLERHNHLQEQQIKALIENVEVQQEQLSQISHLSLDPRRSILQRQRHITQLNDQRGHSSRFPRFSSPLVVVSLVLLILLLLGGSLGIYSIALGHLPWWHNPTPAGHITEFLSGPIAVHQRSPLERMAISGLPRTV